MNLFQGGGELRKFLIFISAVLFCNFAFGQALPVSKMQQSLSGVIERKMIQRGFAANDPRFAQTLNLVSSSTASIAGTVAAAVVAGTVTAPAWATVAIAAGVGTIVTVGVSLAIDGVTNWLFSPDSAQPKPITVSKKQSSSSSFSAGGPYWKSTIADIAGSDAMSVIITAISVNWPSTATDSYEIGKCTYSSLSVSCLVTRVALKTGYKQSGYAGVGANFQNNGSPGSCPSGYVYRLNFGCIAVPKPAPTQVTPQEATDSLPPPELAQPLNPSLLAGLADALWKTAAAQPGYSGVPYSASDPITPADATEFMDNNPNSWPPVADFVAPQPSSNSPWLLPKDPTTLTQSPPSSVPQTSINPASSNPLQNLGDDPVVGSPDLEVTPTAQQILQPILDLLPDFRSFAMPSHQSICPKPVFDVFGISIVMDAHCNISEDIRSVLQAVMAAVWVLAAAIIILRA